MRHSVLWKQLFCFHLQNIQTIGQIYAIGLCGRSLQDHLLEAKWGRRNVWNILHRIKILTSPGQSPYKKGCLKEPASPLFS